MSDDMKCPVCNVLLDECGDLLYCTNDHCSWVGNKGLWQALTDSMKEHDLCHDALVERTKELDRTRKALDVAKEGLKEIQDKGEYVNPIELAESYLDEITALEQKDVK